MKTNIKFIFKLTKSLICVLAASVMFHSLHAQAWLATSFFWKQLGLSLFVGALGGAGNLDGTGQTARFNCPAGSVIDGSGDAYVVDYSASTIRKVTSAGVVTTFAGTAGSTGSTDGAGTAARFNGPLYIASDSTGNFFVPDFMNHTIRKITPAGVVTTFAGTAGASGSTDATGSAARFKNPVGVAIDSTDNIYVTDYYNHTIRKITPAGVVTTVAGAAGTSGSTDGTGSAARFKYPMGVAVDSTDNIYVVDAVNHTLRKVTPAGVVTTFAGSAGSTGSTNATGSAARFNYPYSIAIDSMDNIYVADSANQLIRKVTSAGVVTTFAGSTGAIGSTDATGGAARFNSPFGVGIDSSDNLYVGDCANAAVRKITSGGAVTTLAGSTTSWGSTNATGAAARFYGPSGLAVDSSGSFYATDTSNHTIRKITPAGVVTTFAGTAGSTGSTNATGSAARFTYPFGIAIDSADNIYVTDYSNSTIRKITPAGVVTTFAGSAGSTGSTDATGSAARFRYPVGIAVDSADNLFVTDYGNYTIRKITPAGVVTTIAGTAGAIGSTDATGSAARFNYPYGIAIDSADNIYVADSANHTIRKITPAGVVTTFAGTAGALGSTDATGAAARFKSPYSIATDSAGNLYVGSQGYTLRKITPAGVVTTLAGTDGVAGVSLGAAAGPLNTIGGLIVYGNTIYMSIENAVIKFPKP